MSLGSLNLLTTAALLDCFSTRELLQRVNHSNICQVLDFKKIISLPSFLNKELVTTQEICVISAHQLALGPELLQPVCLVISLSV